MMNLFLTSLRLLRRHRWSYLGLGAVLVLASTVVGSSLILLSSASFEVAPTQGLTGNATAKLLGLAESGRFMSSFLAILGCFVTILLVSQFVGFVVEGRRREIGQLRLVGASRCQTITLILGEVVALAVFSSVLGALLAIPSSFPYAHWLTAQGNWPPGHAVTPKIAPFIGCVTLMVLVSVMGVWVAARRISKSEPIDAIRPFGVDGRAMPKSRIFLSALGLLVVLLSFLLPAESFNPQVSTSFVGAGAVLAATALAPVIVSLVSKLLRSILSPFSSGSVLIAFRNVAFEPRRSAALASTVTLLLGLAAVFGMLAQTGRSEMAIDLVALRNTTIVAETNGEVQPADLALNDDIQETTRIARLDDWSWGESGHPVDDYPQLMGVDPSTVDHFVPLRFLEGRASDISEHNVAAVRGYGEIGENFVIQSPEGAKLHVVVTAVVEPSSFVYGNFLVDLASNQFPIDSSDQIWLIDTVSSADVVNVQRTLAASGADVIVETHEEWVSQRVQRSVANQQSAIMTLVGGASVLAIVSLAQSLFFRNRQRTDEFQLLSRVGANPSSIFLMVSVESVAVVLTGAVASVLATSLAYFRLDSALEALGSPLSPLVPVEILAGVTIACIGVCVVASGTGAQLSLSRLRKNAISAG